MTDPYPRSRAYRESYSKTLRYAARIYRIRLRKLGIALVEAWRKAGLPL